MDGPATCRHRASVTGMETCSGVGRQGRVLHGRTLVRGHVEAEALVSQTPVCFSPEYFDLRSGTYLERGHELHGRSLAGKILVYPCGRGFSGGAYCIYALMLHGVAPVGCVAVRLETVSLIGMVISGIPSIDSCDENPLRVITSGQRVRLDANRGVVEIGV